MSLGPVPKAILGSLSQHLFHTVFQTADLDAVNKAAAGFVAAV